MEWEWDWTAARFFLDVLILLGFIILGIYTWWTTRNQVTAAAIAKVNDRVGDNETRIRDVEKQLEHLPTHEHLGDIHEKVNAVAGTMREIKGELGAISRHLTLMNDYLLNAGGRIK